MHEKTLTIAIESSCDDTSIAVINEQCELLFYDKIIQDHSEFGGVLPELAARLHTHSLPQILQNALDEISKNYDIARCLKQIGVTTHPGLSVSLNPAIMMAKALSLAYNVPIFGINHLLGHIYSLFLNKVARACNVLLLSGGHSMVIDFNPKKMIDAKQNQELKQKNVDFLTHQNLSSAYAKVLCSTKDDSFGESFDKLCKMLQLGYPGGAIIEKLATFGEITFHFSLPINNKNRIEYSFSGIKNMAREYFLNLNLNNDDFLKLKTFLQTFDISLIDEKIQKICDLCASFQDIAIAHALNKYALCINKTKPLAIVGGASANQILRAKTQKMADDFGVDLFLAPLKYCSDNAYMIARATLGENIKRG